MENLDLSSNQLAELPEADLNRLSELQHLNLARNKLTRLPVRLRGLGNLRKLDLSGNELRELGTNFANLHQLGRLKTLHLSYNPLAILDGLRSASLQFLHADFCGELG